MSNFYLPSGYQFENFIIESVLGSGGFGITYLVRDTLLDTRRAIKEYIPSEFAYREENYFVLPKTEKERDNFEWGLEAFQDEAQTLINFADCENIVSIYQYFEANGTAYFVMEYIKGDTFTDLLKAKKLKPQNIEQLFKGVLNGLKRIHEGGILHKDIKPSNIMVRGSTPILIDFGSARKNNPEAEHTKIITERYSPIEQYDASQKIGCWSDIYSLSATFYKAITGNAPQEASGRVIDDQCKNLSKERTDGFSQQFLKMIDRGLALLPKDRPQDINEWEKSNLSNRKINFAIKRPKNIGYRVVVGGFVVSAVFAFLAIINIIFPNFIQEGMFEMNNPSQNVNYKRDIIAGRDEAPDKPKKRKVEIKPIKIKPIIRNMSVTGYQWKSVNLKTIFEPALLNARSTKGYLEIKHKHPIRMRSKNSRKYINPFLFKKGGKIMIEDIGFLEGNRTIELKSVEQRDNISLIFKVD